MKKYIICLLPFFVLMFGFKSFAYEGYDEVQQWYADKNVYPSDAVYEAIDSYWSSHPDYKAVFFYNDLNASLLQVYIVSDYTWSGNTLRYVVPGAFIAGSSSGINANDSLTRDYDMAFNSNVYQYGFLEYSSQSEANISINWDVPFYSANILPPTYAVTYRELSATPIVDVPLNVTLISPPENYYVEVQAIFELPNVVHCNYYRGNYDYFVSDSERFWAGKDIVPNSDMMLASDLSNDYMHLALIDAWQDVYDTIPLDNVQFRYDGDYSQTIKDNFVSRYTNLRKICCFYGSQIQLMIRYFTIVDDTQFVVGGWEVWKSTSPDSFNELMPTYYQPYLPASGTSGTSTSTGSGSDVQIPPGSGETTGTYNDPSTQIYINQAVPNYPDYPTVASYNQDNILLQFMDTANQLPSFFGQFGNFMALTFAFIPGQVWTVIAIGFMCSIVIMIIKVL